MKRFNKFLALLLVVVMTVGLLPAGVSAAENSNVIFEEDFEDYTSIEKGSGAKDVFQFDPYWGSGTGALDTTAGHSSTKSALLTSTAFNPSGPSWSSLEYGFGRVIALVDASKFEANATYKVSAWFKTSGSGTAKFTIQENGKTDVLNKTNNPAYSLTNTDWVQYEYEFVMPEGITKDEIKVVVGGDQPIATLGAQVWVDDIRVEKTKDAPDPNTPLDESFEDATNLPITVFNGTLQHEKYWGGGAGQIVAGDANTGSHSVKLTASEHSNSSYAGTKYSIGRLVIDINSSAFEVGQTYVASAWFKASSSGIRVNMNVQDANYSNNQQNFDPAWTDVGTEWVRKEVTFTVQENVGSYIKFRFGSSGYTDDESAYLLVDDVRVTKYIPYEYETMMDELVDGNAKLMADVDGTGNDLILKAGKTLDLNGNTLTVDSLSALKGAKVIDSVGGGKVVVAEGNLVLQADNGYLPVKVTGGYVFSEVKLTNHEIEVENIEDTLIYESRPSLGTDNNAAYLADGAADNGLSIIIRLTWTNVSNGTTTTMDVPCSEELIKDIYGGTGAFRLNVTGVDSVENLKVATVITSDAGVTCVSEALAYTAPAV